MVLPLAYATSRRQRNPPFLPFGWGAVTVLLVGAALLIIGIVIILYGFIGFFTGIFNNALGDSFSIGSFFSSFFGAVILFVIGGMLAGVGGWLVRLWWIFLLVGAVAGVGSEANTVRGREAARGPEVRVRCRTCGRLNPEEARFCLSCGQAV
ncbi:MAG TPA: zinc ribbon domain-containing protein [Thermoplasmata archaeon]|nr:zinc ribbon domain-containing protein [Thermoplasmata archaeon]